MYIQINEEKIKIDFNSGITVSVDGPDTSIMLKLMNFKKIMMLLFKLKVII